MQNYEEIVMVKTENEQTRTKHRRIESMDELRGLAVFCMIFYHGFFLIGVVFHYSPGNWLFNFFMPAEPFFAGIFIAVSGISSRLSHSNTKRGLKLLAIALALSAVTVFLLPLLGVEGAGIYFGILHFLSISMLIFALLRPVLNYISPMWGIVLCMVLYILTENIGNGYLGIAPDFRLIIPAKLYELSYLFPVGIHTVTFSSADYFPIFPKLFVFLAGTFFGIYVKAGRVPEWAYKKRIAFLSWLGRHALLVYILHMPIIYVIAFIIKFITSKF